MNRKLVALMLSLGACTPASHRRRREDCTIRFTYGDVKSWKYSELKGED